MRQSRREEAIGKGMTFTHKYTHSSLSARLELPSSRRNTRASLCAVSVTLRLGLFFPAETYSLVAADKRSQYDVVCHEKQKGHRTREKPGQKYTHHNEKEKIYRKRNGEYRARAS